MAALSLFSSPELLMNIFQFLTVPHQPNIWCDGPTRDLPTLAKAARVNSLWFTLSTDILWGYSHNTRHLINVERNRRQIYAEKITIIDSLRWRAPHQLIHNLLDGLRFRRLRVLRLCNRSGAAGPLRVHLSSYLLATVKDLHFPRCDRGTIELILDEAARNCKQLEKLCINGFYMPCSKTDFAELISRMQSLRSIDFGYTRQVFSPSHKLLISLAELPKLEYLSLCETGHPSFFEHIAKHIESPFPCLSTFRMHGHAKMIPYIYPAMKNLRNVHISTGSHEPGILAPLASINMLESLHVRFTGAVDVSAGDLEFLRRLSHLKHLYLGLSYRRTEARTLTDDAFRSVFSEMSTLESLRLKMRTNMTVKSFLTMFEFCPQLREIDLDGPFDLQKLADMPAPLFPRLTKLTLDTSELEQDEESQQTHVRTIAALIDNHAPSLSSLSFGEENDNKWYRDIREAWADVAGIILPKNTDDADEDSDDGSDWGMV